MENIVLTFPEANAQLPLNFVEGTNGSPYLFGVENEQRKINVRSFFISQFPVTRKLWDHIMNNRYTESEKPVVNCSYNDITGQEGFLKKLSHLTKRSLRLPTETEWEYAARGGNRWGDYFLFSGGDNIDDLAWYKQNSKGGIQPVGLKKPNQLGLYDMCGNVWEWCQDWFVRDTDLIPKDGSPYMTETKDRVLRGGCNHNGAIHCTVSKRYEIPPDSKDGVIGFRVAMSLS